MNNMDTNLGRIPPYNLEAEQSVLGAMLIEKEVVPIVFEMIKSNDFYKENHKEIYEAMQDLFEKDQPIDLVTITEQLKIRNTLEEIGGLEYLTSIAASLPTTANVRYYAKIVEEKSILRKLINASSEISRMSYEAGEEVEFILDQAEKKIFDILQKKDMQGFVPIKDVLEESFNRLEELYKNKENNRSADRFCGP